MRALSTFALAGVAALAAVSFGHGASAELPSYQSIPMSKLPAAPDTSNAPASIPAGEKVDGIFPARPPDEQRKRNEASGYKMVYVFGSDKEARSFTTDGRFDAQRPDGEAPRACIATNGSSSSSSRGTLYLYIQKPTKPKPVAPKPSLKGGSSGGSLSSLGSLSGRSASSKPRSVFFVRSERVVEGEGGKPRLDTTDAWVDIDSLGARQIQKTSTTLARVGSGPSNVDVFASRDEKNVQFVVRPSTRGIDKDVPAHIVSLGTRLSAQTPTGGASMGDCGHMRVSVASEPGSGQMATIVGTAMLPPAPDDDDGTLTEPKDKDEDEDTGASKPKPPRDIRMRPFVASLSVSQTKSEKEPIVSVAFGWSGKDQHQRF